MTSAQQHRDMRDALLQAYPRVTGGKQPNLSELQILHAQAFIESGGCRGSYKLLNHETGEVIAESGVIWNCGAVQTNDPDHGFLATDTSPTLVTTDNPHGYYDHRYRVYPDLASGLENMVDNFVVRRPTSWEFARRGDVDTWAREAHAEKIPGGVKKDPATGVPGYFEQSPDKRAAGTMTWAGQIATALGEEVQIKRGGPYRDVPDSPDANQTGATGMSTPKKVGIVAFLLTVLATVGALWARR